MSNAEQLAAENAILKAENERLRGLVKKAWFDGYNEGAVQENGTLQWEESVTKQELEGGE